MVTRAEGAATELERRVLVGIYPSGTQLPGEAQLGASLGVSRTTLREAVGRLVGQGLLRREQGRGTYVQRRPGLRISMLLEANLSISDMIRDMGMTPATSDVEVSLELPPQEVGIALGEPGLGQALVVRRVRTADGEPAVFSTDYLPVVPGLPLDRSSYTGSVYEMLAAFHGTPVTSGHARLQAGAASPDLAAKLGISAGDLTLVLSQVHGLADGTTVMFSYVHLRNDVFSVFVRRGPSDAAQVHVEATGDLNTLPDAVGAPKSRPSREVVR